MGRTRYCHRDWSYVVAGIALWLVVLSLSARSAWQETDGAPLGIALFQHLLWTFPAWLALLVLALWHYHLSPQRWWRRPAGWGILLSLGGLLPTLGFLVALWSLQQQEAPAQHLFPSPDGTWQAHLRRGIYWTRPTWEIWLRDEQGRHYRLERLQPDAPPVSELTWAANGYLLGALLGRSELRLWDVRKRAELAHLRIADLGLPASIWPFQLRLDAEATRFFLASTRPGSRSAVIWSVARDGSQPESHLYLEGIVPSSHLDWRVTGSRIEINVPDPTRVVVVGPEGVRSLAVGKGTPPPTLSSADWGGLFHSLADCSEVVHSPPAGEADPLSSQDDNSE